MQNYDSESEHVVKVGACSTRFAKHQEMETTYAYDDALTMAGSLSFMPAVSDMEFSYLSVYRK